MTKSTPTRVVLTSVGHYFPETILDNKFFEELDIDTTEQWIEERIGIKERRSILKKEDIVRLRRGETDYLSLRKEGRIMSMVDMSKPAWAVLLDRLSPESRQLPIDMVLCGTGIQDYDVSANAAYIAAALGIECASFDVNAACSSFALHTQLIRSMMETGQSKKAVSFIIERFTTRQNYADRSNSILFGDSGVAAVFEANSTSPGFEVIDCTFTSAPSGAKHIVMNYGEFFNQSGAPVQKFAITTTVAATKEILARNGLAPKDISYFISHQANLRMLSSVIERLGLTEKQHLFNIDYYGNQGASGAPAVLSQNWDRFKPGDYVVMTVVGAGLSWGAILLKKTG